MLNHLKLLYIYYRKYLEKKTAKFLGVEASSSFIYIFLPGDALSAWKTLRGPPPDEAPKDEIEDRAVEGMTSLLFARNTAPPALT